MLHDKVKGHWHALYPRYERPSRVQIRRAALRVVRTPRFCGSVRCERAVRGELAGVPGATAVRGLGIAFLMWNATYPAVIASPARFRALGVVVLAQQAIGLAGESWIRLSLPAGHEALAASIDRFVVFDAAGLALMGVAFAWLLVADRRARHAAP